MEQMCLYFAVFISLGFTSGQLLANQDNCTPRGHSELKQPNRSTGYYTLPSDTPLCDSGLKRGWYKFTGHDGLPAQMPTTCPGRNTCGTTTPIWMDGQHPTQAEGIISAALCAQVSPNGNCCEYKDQVFVQNCGDFYIYYLDRVPDCPSSYCAGTAKRCPLGKSSPTNFEPCRGPAPELHHLPVVKGPIVNSDQTFYIQCEFHLGPTDPDQVFQVLWTFNGKSDPFTKPEVLTGGQRAAVLSGNRLRNHLDSDVGCQVNAYYLGREKDKNTYKSKTNHIGVQELKLTGPNLRSRSSFDFQCEVTVGSDDPDQRIEFIWTFDGMQDAEIPAQIITGQQRKVTLDGSKLRRYLNTHVGCQARLKYDGYAMETKLVQSNIYFAGIQISTDKLQIPNSQEEKDLTVTSTIPIVCERDQDCCLGFNFKVDNSAVVSLKNSCEKRLCLSDWDPIRKKASFTITVVPARSAVSGVVRHATLSFENIVLSGTASFLHEFAAFKPNPVQIEIVLEAGFTCSITGDPHIKGFDSKRNYDLYNTGDYTVYAVKERDFLVQIRTWPCWRVTCVCGVVVKEKNDIIRVEGCHLPARLISSTVDVPYDLSPGTVVQRSGNGQHIGILLPSGSEIKLDISQHYMNVYIQTPAFDKSKAVGMCGTNDGNAANDFTHPNGHVTPACGRGPCIPVAFTESWRVSGSASMFVVTPRKVEAKPVVDYCACRVASNGKIEQSCSPREHIQESQLSCKNCHVITATLKPSPWGQQGQGQTVVEPKEVAPGTINTQWPSGQGLTEAQARSLCVKAIQNSQLYSRCQQLKSLVDDIMTQCLGDILNGDTTEALPAITSSFTTNCQMTLAKDAENYVQGPDGKQKLNPELNDNLCPLECLENGKCGPGGRCLCKRGWEADTCQIESGRGPQIRGTTGGPLCHANQKPCDSVTFEKSNVNIHDKLKCRVQPINDQGRKTGRPVILDAVSGSSTTVTCPLLKSEQSSQKFMVSISTNGVVYGNELPVYTFDPTCLDCNMSGCKTKTTACQINNICYKHRDINRHNQRQVCDVNRNTNAWTTPSIPV